MFFQNGSRFEVKRDGEFQRLDNVFPIRPHVPIPAGDYGFATHAIEYESDASKPVFGNVEYKWGGFYNGEKRSLVFGAAFRPSYRLSLHLHYSLNDVDLPQGSFETHLVLFRSILSFNTRTFLSALIQYNNETRRISTNVRFNFIHRPLSDFFVVYNEQRSGIGDREIDRSLILKYTHLLDF